MLYENIVTIADLLLEYDMEQLIQRFSEQVPEGHNGMDAVAIVNTLEECLKTIKSAADSGKLQIVPMKFLSDINGTLTNIKTDFEGTRPASQTIPRIMNLHGFLWTARVLGEQDHVGVVLTELGIAKKAVEEAKRTRLDLVSVRNQMDKTLVEISEASGFVEEVRNTKNEIDSFNTQISSILKSSKEISETIKTYEQDSQRAKVNSEQYNSDIEEWSERVGELESKSDLSVQAFDNSRDSFEEFLGEASNSLRDHMTNVNDLLQKATGASLFSAFEQKKRNFAWVSAAWGALSLASIAGAIVFAFWLVGSISDANSSVGAELWVKLSISPLFLLLIGFASTQYASSKRTEDEYAFKSTLSLSLEPYRDLVARMSDEQFANSHLEFVVEMIREIFSSPYNLKSKIYADKVDAKIEKVVADMLLDIAKKQVGVPKSSD